MGAYHRLAEANPDAYLPDLAMSLWAYGWVCVNVKAKLLRSPGADHRGDQHLSAARAAATADIRRRAVLGVPPWPTYSTASAAGRRLPIYTSNSTKRLVAGLNTQ
jgi:hypothetical protein